MRARVIRQASAADFSVLGDVMFAAVREGESPYNAQQRESWVPEPRSGELWNTRLREQYVLLAETEERTIGFMSLASRERPKEGYIDFAYILPDARGLGLFRQLYTQIEAEAILREHSELFTHASLMAAPAFSKMGFCYLEKETVTIKGQKLQRFHMRKSIV